MATLMNTLQLTDGYALAIRDIDQSIETMTGKFAAFQNVTQNFMKVEVIQSARQEINKLEETTEESCGYMDKLKKTMGDLKVGEGIQKAMALSDKMLQTRAKLNMANDGQQSTAELQESVYQSANRSGASYEATAGAVASLSEGPGDTFSDNGETIAFVEALNKSMAIAGASQEQMDSTRTELVQALGSGGLNGDDFSSIFANVPQATQMIADYMDVPVEQMNTLAEQGAITGDVVKGAFLSSIGEIDTKFEAMPMTFAQIGTVITNTLLETFEPLLQGLAQGAQFILDHWSVIEPIFWGIAAAVAAYAAITGIMTIVTWAAKIAQDGLKASLLANPIIWIALVIGILIGVIYNWIQSVGGIEIAWKIAVNGVLTIFDLLKIGFFVGVNWILNLFDKLMLGIMVLSVGLKNYMRDMKANFIMILQNMVNGGIDIINGFIEKLNKIPGVSLELIEKVSFGTNNQLINEAQKQARNEALEAYKNDIVAGMADREAKINQMKDDARKATSQRQSEIDEMKRQSAVETEDAAITPQPYEQQTTAEEETASNTARMANTMDVAEEDLTYLRDLAEQDVINRFTTAEIKVDMGGITNQVSGEQDLDGMVEYLENTLYETMAVASEGVHE